MIAILPDETIKKYEQDIREILMAFFPGETFCYEKKPEAGLFVCAEENGIRLETVQAAGSAAGGTTYEEAFSKASAENASAEGGHGAFYEPLTLCGVRKEDKSRVKRALYAALHRLTGEALPWGTLTGIRPVRLSENLLRNGDSDEAAKETLKEQYLISERKAELILDIAHREQAALSGLDYRNGYSLYAGIPFCPTTCMYCSFTSYPIGTWQARVGEYLDCLRRELAQLRRAQETEGSILFGKALQTVYIGGGTPTALSAEDLRRLLSMISEEMDLRTVREFTVEAGRPDSITPEKLTVLSEYGIGRISINPQTMNQKTLDLIGRRHTAQDVKNAFFMARNAGFSNINMDLIMGLPQESVEDVKHTLCEIEKLAPESLTVHALAVKRAARLNIEGNAWAHLARAGKEEAAEMMRLAEETAERLSLKPYYLYRQKNMAGNQENVGYAASGKENLYNILMMQELHTVIGCGAGASSKAVAACGVTRHENIKNIAEYLPRMEEQLLKKEQFLYPQGKPN